jgi:hypothetical protein
MFERKNLEEQPYEIDDYIEVRSKESDVSEDEADFEEEPKIDEEFELDTNDSEGEVFSAPSDISSEIVLDRGTHDIDMDFQSPKPNQETEIEHTNNENSVELKESSEQLNSKENEKISESGKDVNQELQDMEVEKETIQEAPLPLEIKESEEKVILDEAETEQVQKPEVEDSTLSSEEEPPKKKKSVRISEYIRTSVQKLEEIEKRSSKSSASLQQPPAKPDDEVPPTKVDEENDNKK